MYILLLILIYDERKQRHMKPLQESMP